MPNNDSSVTYPYPTLPERNQHIPVAPGIEWIRMALPWSLNHINLWLMEDRDGYAIVDTGLGNEESRDQWASILDGLDRPITQIIVTHFHPDHLGNAEWLAQRTKAPIAMSLGEYLLAHALYDQTSGYDVPSMLQHFRRHGLAEVHIEALAKRGNVFRRGVPTIPFVFRRILDGDTLHIGGRTWRAIAGYGHSHEHIALHCEALGVLISGDMLLPRITTNIAVPATLPDEDSVQRFLDSIKRFNDLPEDTLVLPAHGLPFHGAHVRVNQLLRHHEERDALLLSVLDEPKSAADVLGTLFSRELDAHQLMFAMGEAIAHMNHQWSKGWSRRIESTDGVVRYQKIKKEA